MCGWPPGLPYFVDLFGNRVQNYVERILDGGERSHSVLSSIRALRDD